MTDEEIKKLAEDCSLYYQGRPAKRGYELSNRLTIESYAKMTLKWLSERYCIVPKSKVKELYAKTESDHCHVDEDNDWVVDMMLGRMEDIFGKDMFEEEGK